MYIRKWVIWEGFLEEVTFKSRAERKEMEILKENLTSFFNSYMCEMLSHIYLQCSDKAVCHLG